MNFTVCQRLSRTRGVDGRELPLKQRLTCQATLWSLKSQGLVAAELPVCKITCGMKQEVSQWYTRLLRVLGRACEDCGQAKRQEVEAGLPVTWKENFEWKKEEKKKRHSWWIPHQAVLLTEMRESYLASEINKSVWIQKNSAGNGISTKFKISKCEWQLLTDVRPLFVF